jgi:hypothetical protein
MHVSFSVPEGNGRILSLRRRHQERRGSVVRQGHQSGTRAQRRFELEPLEPRVLLSVGPVLGSAALAAGAHAHAAGPSQSPHATVVQHTGVVQQDAGYNPAGNVAGLFEGMAVESLAAPAPVAAPSVSEPAAPKVEAVVRLPAARVVSPSPKISTAPSSVVPSSRPGNPMTQQLTGTLRVANAPPGQGQYGSAAPMDVQGPLPDLAAALAQNQFPTDATLDGVLELNGINYTQNSQTT